MKKSMVLCVLSLMSGMVASGNVFATTDNTVAAPTTNMPPPEMSALYPRVGKWNVVVRTEPGRSSPKGGVDRGVMTIVKGPGGFSVVQDFWSNGTSGHVVGQSYTWWDAQSKAYKSVWCDNMQGCTEFTTTIHGNTWTVEFDSQAGSEKVHTVIRAQMSEDHNAIHETVANSYNGGPAQTETVSDYKRIVEAIRKN